MIEFNPPDEKGRMHIRQREKREREERRKKRGRHIESEDTDPKGKV